MKKIFLMLCLLIFLIGSISAFDIAYVLKDSSSPNQQFIDSINDLGYTYELIDDSEISATNFSEYEMILVDEGNFGACSLIPVNEKKSMIMNTKHLDDWGWINDGVSSISPNRPQELAVFDDETIITKGIGNSFIPYVDNGLQVDTYKIYYLHKNKQTQGIKTIVADGLSFWQYLGIYVPKNGAVIATIEEGVELKNGKTNNAKGVFFGITNTELWSQKTKQLFKNSIVWLMKGQYPKPECNTEILEDYEETCELNSDFVFSVIDEDNLNCEINGNEMKYKSVQDYYGEASCLIKIEDSGGYEIFSFEVNIAPVNDAPVIDDYFPEQESLKIIENRNQEFKIEAHDVDSVLEINWFVDDVGVCSEEGYIFNKEKGNYIVKAILNDGEFYLNKLWNVLVGLSSEFTCSEVGGNICSENQFCPREIINVKDTNNCCSVSCLEKPLEFPDAEQCSNKSDLIEITIKEPDENDDFEIGEIIEVEIKIKNKFDEKLDFEIEAHLYDLDEDESVEDAKEEIKIKAEKSETLELEIEIPEDVEDNDFVIYVFVEDENERCNSEYVEIDIERKEHDVIIQDIEISEIVYQGDDMEVRVEIKNIGSDDEDVYIKIENSELNILEKTEEFEIEEYGDDDKETKTFYIKIPEDVEEKEYEIKATVIFDDHENSKTESFNILKKSEEKDISKKVESSKIINLGKEEGAKGEVISLGSIEKSEVEDVEIKIKFEEESKKEHEIKKTDFGDFSFCNLNSPCKYPPCINHIMILFILALGVIITSICITLIKRRRH